MTVFGITVFLHPKRIVLVSVCTIALQLLRLSYTGLLFPTVIEDKFEHPVKAWFPIVVTEFGMFIVDRPLRLANA